jgi:ribonuclease P protein component
VAVPHLKRRAEFLKIAREGIARSTPGLVLQMLRRDNQDTMERDPTSPSTGDDGGRRHAAGPRNRRPGPAPDAIRVGITASRKVGGAVVRNRVRRRLRALADNVLAEAGQPGCDYVLIGRHATAARPYAALIEDLRRALQGVQHGRVKRTGPSASARPERRQL